MSSSEQQHKDSAEKTVREIRRRPRRRYLSEEKIGIVVDGLRSCVARKGSIRTCITVARNSFWRPAKNAWPVTRPGRRAPLK